MKKMSFTISRSDFVEVQYSYFQRIDYPFLLFSSFLLESPVIGFHVVL